MAEMPSAKQRRWVLTLAMSGAGVALLALGIITRSADALVALLALALVGLPGFLLTRLQAYLWKRRVVRPGLHLLRVLVPLALLTAALCWGLVTGYGALGLFA